MTFFTKQFSLIILFGLALSLNTLQLQAQSNLNENLVGNVKQEIPSQISKLGWGKTKNETVLPSSNTKNTVDLQSTKLQGGIPSYTCSANYFASSSIDYVQAFAADGQGNTYMAGTKYIPEASSVNTFSRISSSGVVTSFNVNANYSLGRIVANTAGDVYQINYDFISRNYLIFKIPAGTTNYNLIHTIGGNNEVYPEGLKIDNSGNLYVIYSPFDLIFNTTSTKIDKLNGNGGLIATFTLPAISSYGQDKFYRTDKVEISNSGLIFVPMDRRFGSTAAGLSNLFVVVLNTDGTKKADFQFSSDAFVSNIMGIAALPSGVAGGGVYVSYKQNSSSVITIKRILDTDTAPISTTPTFSITGTVPDSYTFKLLPEFNNSFIYIYNNGSLQRFNTSTQVLTDVVPVGNNTYSLYLARNSANEIVISSDIYGDIFKLNCSTGYVPVTVSLNNIDTDQVYCNQSTGAVAEVSNFYCSFNLVKGLTFVMPTEIRASIVGSGTNTNSCSISGSDLYCYPIPTGNITTSGKRAVQLNFNGGAFSTVATLDVWQAFGNWTNNPITLAGKTDEILYNSRMYQAAFGTDSGLYIRFMDTSGVFSNWQRLSSITAKSSPVLSIDPNGDLYVFAQGTDNGLYFWKVGEAGGERWRRFGGITIKDAVTLHNFNGKYWLYATGTDNGSYIAKFSTFGANVYANPTWMKAGDITVEKTVHGIVSNGNLYQIAVGTDFGLYYRTAGTNDTFGQWVRYFDYTYSEMGRPVISDNKIALSLKSKYGTPQNVLIKNFPYYAQAGLDSTAVNNLNVFNNQLSEAGYGVDGKFYHRAVYPVSNYSSSSNWIQGNGITIKSAPTQFSFNNKQYQFVRGSDNKLWMRSRS